MPVKRYIPKNSLNEIQVLERYKKTPEGFALFLFDSKKNGFKANLFSNVILEREGNYAIDYTVEFHEDTEVTQKYIKSFLITRLFINFDTRLSSAQEKINNLSIFYSKILLSKDRTNEAKLIKVFIILDKMRKGTFKAKKLVKSYRIKQENINLLSYWYVKFNVSNEQELKYHIRKIYANEDSLKGLYLQIIEKKKKQLQRRISSDMLCKRDKSCWFKPFFNGDEIDNFSDFANYSKTSLYFKKYNKRVSKIEIRIKDFKTKKYKGVDNKYYYNLAVASMGINIFRGETKDFGKGLVRAINLIKDKRKKDFYASLDTHSYDSNFYYLINTFTISYNRLNRFFFKELMNFNNLPNRPKPKTTKKTAISSRSKVISSPPLRSRKRGVKKTVPVKKKKYSITKAKLINEIKYLALEFATEEAVKTDDFFTSDEFYDFVFDNYEGEDMNYYHSIIVKNLDIIDEVRGDLREKYELKDLLMLNVEDIKIPNKIINKYPSYFSVKKTPTKRKTTKKTALNSRSKVISSPPLRSRKRGVKKPVSPKINKMNTLKAPKTRIGKILTLPKGKQNIILKLPTRTQNAILKEPKAKQKIILASVKTAKAYTISGNKTMAKRKLPARLVKMNTLATAKQKISGRKADKKVQGAYRLSRTSAIKAAKKELDSKDRLMAHRKRGRKKQEASRERSMRNARRIVAYKRR